MGMQSARWALGLGLSLSIGVVSSAAEPVVVRVEAGKGVVADDVAPADAATVTSGVVATQPAAMQVEPVAPAEQPMAQVPEVPATQEAESRSAIAHARIIPGPGRSTLIYICQEARPEALVEAINGLLTPQGSAQASAALNRLVVNDEPATIDAILAALVDMDRTMPQLLIEARVVEVKLDSDLEYALQHLLTIPPGDNAFLQSGGVTLLTPGGSPSVGQGLELAVRPWASDGKYFDTFVRLLATRGKGKILSSPNLIVAPGTEGSIITGQEVPVQSATIVSGSVNTTTQFKRVGIKLRVNLLQITHDTARVEVNPEVSSVTGFTTVTKEGITNPIIAIRNVSSTLTLKDGEVLTVGGLLQTEDSQIVRGVPLLMDVPVIGALFQSRRNVQSKTQLIFFLRAHILPAGEVGGMSLHRPGSSLEDLDRQMGLELPPGVGKYPVSAKEVLNLDERRKR